MCRRNFEGALNRLQLNPLKRRVKPLKFDYHIEIAYWCVSPGNHDAKIPSEKGRDGFQQGVSAGFRK